MIFLYLLLSPVSALTMMTASATSSSSRSTLQPQTTPPVRELLARQQSALATCGFINGDGAKPVTCGSSLYCATTSTYVGCCPLSNCRDIFTTCYDLLGSLCDEPCQNNPQNLVCPTALAYCARYNYEGGSVGFGCASIRGYTSTVLLTTKGSLPSLVTNTTSAHPAPTNNTTSGSSTVTTTSEGGLSTGATAGIAVGVTLGVVALALWIGYLLWKKRKGRKDQEQSIQEKSSDTISRADVRTSVISEMGSDAKSPTSQQFRYSPLPHYSEHFSNVPVEMPGNHQMVNRPPTEISSIRE